ncbi:MAG: hypothetical protein ABEI77_07540 [Halorientalis sp.]
MSRHTIKIDDPELQGYLDSADNKSEAIREALRAQVADESGSATAPGLSDIQRKGLDVLLAESFKTSGPAAGKLSKDVAESQLAQRLQIDAGSVVRVVIRPLLAMGYLRLADRKESLTVYREPQSDTGENRPVPESWSTTGTTECVHTHHPDSTGVCLRCGEDVGTADNDGDPVATDGAGEIQMTGELTECTGEDCNRMLQGSTTTCVDCREK